jgi:hypothetical protein
MTPAETAIIRAAARTNAEWCAAVCRSHGIPSVLGERAWWSTRRSPPCYPDAVTLRDDAMPADFLPEMDTVSPGCSVKDGFAAVDLTPDGFTELFTARWIHRPAELPPPRTPGLRTERVSTAAGLRDWQAAWHGAGDPPDIFRPALLDDPAVLVLAVQDGKHLAGGVILNRGTGPVGLSNLFAVESRDIAAVWSAAITAAAGRFPGLPIVGYEQEDDLAPALAGGFTALGALRVWLHECRPSKVPPPQRHADHDFRSVRSAKSSPAARNRHDLSRGPDRTVRP